MADQQNHKESPLNAFYAALLSGKLTFGSLGSGFAGPNPEAAIKRKAEDALPIAERIKKQRPEQQKLAPESSRSVKPDHGRATSDSKEVQQLEQQPAASVSGIRSHAQHGSASSGKKYVPAWQRAESDNENEGAREGRDKVQQRAIGHSEPGAGLSNRKDRTACKTSSSSIPFNSLHHDRGFASPAGTSAQQREALSPDAASETQLTPHNLHQPPDSLFPSPGRGVPGPQSEDPPSRNTAKAEPWGVVRKSTAGLACSSQQEAGTGCLRQHSRQASAAGQMMEPSEQAILESLQTNFLPAQSIDNAAAQVSSLWS